MLAGKDWNDFHSCLIKNNKLLEGGGEKNSKKIQKKMEKL
jgi:hypothetical protein